MSAVPYIPLYSIVYEPPVGRCTQFKSPAFPAIFFFQKVALPGTLITWSAMPSPSRSVMETSSAFSVAVTPAPPEPFPFMLMKQLVVGIGIDTLKLPPRFALDATVKSTERESASSASFRTSLYLSAKE